MLHGFDDADLAAAAALRAEWRADEDAWTRAALEQWEHDRTFADVLRACMHRGDTVALEFPGRSFVGVFTAVGDDVARVATADGSVDAHLHPHATLSVRVVAAARAGGDRGDPTIATFRARLLQLDGTVVQLGAHAHEHALTGRLRVGRDQVSVVDRDGAVRYVPTGSVSWVRPVDVD
jgi:hypothetical protein